MVSPYCELRSGMKELLSILWGLIYILELKCYTDQESLLYGIKAIKISVWLLCLLGVFEIVTGYHLNTSKLVNPQGEDVSFLRLAYASGHYASGVFFNVNDYCAFLAIFTPLFFWWKEDTPNKSIVNSLFLLLGVLFVMMENDANIAATATMLGVFTSLFTGKIHQRSKHAWLVLLIPPLAIGAIFVIRKMIWILSVQELTKSQGIGSFYNRLAMYRDCLVALKKTHGFGVGPNGLTTFFTIHGRTSAEINPHSWWHELVAKYGIIVFVTYVVFFFSLLFKLFKGAVLRRIPVIRGIFGGFISFILACIAPSTFLGNVYHWIVLWMGYAVLTMPVKGYFENEKNSYSCWSKAPIH